MRTFHQQPAQVPVSGFGDAQLWIMFAGLAALWPEFEITAHLATLGKALPVGQGQDKSGGGDGAAAEDTPQGSNVGILLLRHSANLCFETLDLFGELCNLLDYWQQRDLHLGR